MSALRRVDARAGGVLAVALVLRASVALASETPAALPGLVRTYCAGGGRLAEAAGDELRRRGLPAFDALTEAGGGCDASSVAADLLCETAPINVTALRASLGRLVPQVTSAKSRTAPVYLWFMLVRLFPPAGEVRQPGCRNRDVVAKVSLDVLFTPDAAARIAPRNQPAFARALSSLLASQPSRGHDYVPVLARWLAGDLGNGPPVAQALADMATVAAPAVPALRAYLARAIEGERASKDLALGRLPGAAQAAASIGRAALPMLGELRAALSIAAGRMCDWNRADEAGTILEALGKLDPSGWDGVRATVEAAWERGGKCEQSGLSLRNHAGTLGRARLMDGVATFGPAAASFTAVSRAALNDARASLDSRGHAARALRNIGARLDTREDALAQLLAQRLSRREREAAITRSQPDPEAWNKRGPLAIDEMVGCMADANIVEQKPMRPAAIAAFAYDENRRFATCVGARLCGPGPDALAETLGTCCDYAYAAARPEFCPAGR